MSGQPMPAVLDVERVRRLAAGSGFALEAVDRIDSTNEAVGRRLGPGAGGYALVAEYQTAGRGRKGRAWIAPAGSALTFTTVLPRPIPTAALWAVPFWSALVVAAAVESVAGARVRLVWPNDVFLGQRKVAGILAVSRVAGDAAHVGIGTGINVRRPHADAGLERIAPPPAFLSDADATIEREPLLAAILQTYAVMLDDLATPQQIARAWEARADLRGTPYAYRRDDGAEGEGIAQRLGADGGLVVRGRDGELELSLADVRIVRHAS